MQILSENGLRIALMDEADAPLRGEQDALDLIADMRYTHQAYHLVIPAAILNPAFFDLRSGLAGGMLQKFVNYRVRVAIVGDFTGYKSKALRQFIMESNKGGHVCFASSLVDALAAFRG